jgi:hypothetical protein
METNEDVAEMLAKTIERDALRSGKITPEMCKYLTTEEIISVLIDVL